MKPFIIWFFLAVLCAPLHSVAEDRDFKLISKENPIRIKVSFDGDRWTEFESSFRRKLRGIGDVAIVDTDADWIVQFTLVEIKNGARIFGYAISEVVIQPLDLLSWTNTLGPRIRYFLDGYPKRFYNDSTRVAVADACKSYPEHSLVSRLFAEAAERIDSLWKSGVDQR